MSEPHELTLKRAHHNDVLRAMSRASPEELDESSEQYSDEQKDQIISLCEETLINLKNQALLILGALMTMTLSLINSSYRHKYIQESAQKLNSSRTQIYRSMAIWKAYGKLMLEEQELLSMFAATALDITSREDVPEAARKEAIQLARQGDFISIKLAKSICEKHGVVFKKKVAKQPAPTSTPVIAKEVIFKGNFIQIVWEKRDSEEGAFYREIEQALKALVDYKKVSNVISSPPHLPERRHL